MTQCVATQDPYNFRTVSTETCWVTTMNDELEALKANDTWSLTTLSPGKKAMGSKWLFKTKFNPDGSEERLKARLMILGCRQREGIDYEQTFH